MTTTKLLFLLLVVLGCAQNEAKAPSEKALLRFQSVKFHTTPKMAELQFELKNQTQETLYLSTDNIKFKVEKDGKFLTNHPPPQAFPPMMSNSASDGQDNKSLEEPKTKVLKSRFAIKMINHNFRQRKKTFDTRWLTEQILDKCILLLPKQSVTYSTYFWNKSLDQKCKITGQVVNSNQYMEFQDNDFRIQSLRYP